MALARLRQEHNTVFGSTFQTAQKLKEDPKILNQLPYTLAVIKEALRLLPPIVGTYRVGRKEYVSTSSRKTNFLHFQFLPCT